MECKSCLQKITEKLIDTSPLQFVLTRKLSCLDLRKMTDKTVFKDKMKVVLDSLVEVKRISAVECDDVLRQFEEFLNEYCTLSEFTNFDPNVN